MSERTCRTRQPLETTVLMSAMVMVMVMVMVVVVVVVAWVGTVVLPSTSHHSAAERRRPDSFPSPSPSLSSSSSRSLLPPHSLPPPESPSRRTHPHPPRGGGRDWSHPRATVRLDVPRPRVGQGCSTRPPSGGSRWPVNRSVRRGTRRDAPRREQSQPGLGAGWRLDAHYCFN